MVAVPDSLAGLLGRFRGCFTAPTFATFCALMCGLVCQTGRSTVCGMWVGAGLSRSWPHHRAHRFFSHARWSVPQVSAVLARLVVELLVPDGQPVTVAIDDTLFHRRGPKVHAASWFHDGSAIGRRKVGFGNNWVIAALVVHLPCLDRPLALPVGFALVVKGTTGSRLRLARDLTWSIAEVVPDRRIQVVATPPTPAASCAAYQGGSRGPPGCGPMPPYRTWRHRAPGGADGPGSRATDCRSSPTWPTPPPSPPRSRTGTAPTPPCR